MLWTATNAATAKLEGWELRETIDNGSSAVYLRVYSLVDQKHVNASALVLERARGGSRLHVEALRAISQSRIQPKRKRK